MAQLGLRHHIHTYYTHVKPRHSCRVGNASNIWVAMVSFQLASLALIEPPNNASRKYTGIMQPTGGIRCVLQAFSGFEFFSPPNLVYAPPTSGYPVKITRDGPPTV